jgi:8-amino-7-oxononanoate synthase
MKPLDTAIRSKRFKVKAKSEIILIIDSVLGGNIHFRISDCSATGLAGSVETTEQDDHSSWLNLGGIVSSAKIKCASGEYSLGRLVLRRFSESEGLLRVAFSTVDSNVPVDGVLSHFIDLDLEKDNGVFDVELSSNKFNLAHFVEGDFNSADLFNRAHKFQIFFKDWVGSAKYAYQNIREKSKGPRIDLSRKRKGGRKDYIMMGSNDYLGLSSHPEVIGAVKDALDEYGFGSTGSPVTTGLTDLHVELCSRIAKMHQKEDAVLFNSGYVANVGTITSLCGARDLIIADQLSHASIQDAMNMSKGTPRYFMHNNVAHLEKILKAERKDYNGALVITEGVFSMDGDVPPLDKIYEVCREYNARLMVDQAHCFGVVGETGLGACEKYGLLRDADIIMGTFSKISGGIGGFVTGNKEVIDWIKHFARGYIFSVSLPPATVAGVTKSLEIFRRDPSLVKNLHKNIAHFTKGLESIGYRFEHAQESAVIPVVIGDEKKLGVMYQSLLDDGVIVIPIVYPAVGQKNCRFRFTVMATHTFSDLDYVIISLEKAMIKADFSFEQLFSSKLSAGPLKKTA